VSDFDIATYEKGMRAWVVATSGLPLSKVYWGQQDCERPREPAIELRIFSTHTLGQAWVDVEDNFVAITPLTITLVTPSSGELTTAAHGFTNGDGPVRVASTGVIPGGLVAGKDYWVILDDLNTIRLADTFVRTGGAYVNGAPSGNAVTSVVITSAGSGVITLSSAPKFVRGAGPVRFVGRSMERVGLMLTSFTSDGVGMLAAMGIMNRIKSRQKLPSSQAILKAAHLGLTSVERARALHGMRGAALFEPRALMEVYFSVAMQSQEDGQSIERFTAVNSVSGKRITVELP